VKYGLEPPSQLVDAGVAGEEPQRLDLGPASRREPSDAAAESA